MLTFGEGKEAYAFELHRLESDPPILWQYICDPDWAEYLELRRASEQRAAEQWLAADEVRVGQAAAALAAEASVLQTPDDVSSLVLKYIELKSGYSDNGPAWVARVKLSKSGRTVYFNGKALHRASGGGVSGNHFDIETREEYWVSGVKKSGLDRHWAGGGIVSIEASAVVEYLARIGATTLDLRRFRVVPDLAAPDPAKFVALENAKLQP